MKLEEVNLKTKEAVDYLVQSLESGQSAVLTQYLGAMAKFRNYSFGNIMLIARQKPDATHVAGYRTWTTLGRFVRRGEKGIFILAPMVGNKRKKNENQAENAEQTTDAKETQPTLYGFRGVYVFDIAQTEGKELPALTEVQGDVSGYRERLVKFVEGQGITLNYSEHIAPAKGLSYGGKITLLSGMQPAEEFSTLTHEIAHEMLHRGDRRTLTTKQVRETEAEAWEAADRLISRITDEAIAVARERRELRFESEGQRRMTALHGFRRDALEVAPNLWAGVGLIREGAGTGLVGDPKTVAERLRAYQAVGVDTIIASGYPHLEEAYKVAELLFPALGIERKARDTDIVGRDFVDSRLVRAS